MRDGTTPNAPDVATIGTMIGDRARAAMLMSLMEGRSLTATEMARAAGVTKQTASTHLSKLARARLVAGEQVGRHRYFRLADHEVAAALEGLVGLANRAGLKPIATGPADPVMRKARVCYDHLAGDMGVMMFDSLVRKRRLRVSGEGVSLTDDGARFLAAQGVEVDALRSGRRPLCLACLDWSARTPHLAGAVGAALLERILERGWARRRRGTREVWFSVVGERALLRSLA